MLRRAARWIATAAAAWLAACNARPARSPAASDPVRTAARAYRIERPEQLLSGPAADGRTGDYRIDNGIVAAVVNAPDNALGFAFSGGNVIDAARAGGDDALRQVFVYLDDQFPRQAVFDRVDVAVAEGDEAVLVARGVDSDDPAVEIVHEVRLAAGADYLTLRTTVRNRGPQPVTGYELGDVIQWGACERFAPGSGDARGRLDLPWVAGDCGAVSYGYAAARGRLGGPHGSSWSDPVVDTVDLAPGASSTYERFLIVGDGGGVATVAGRALALRGEPVRPVAGTVVDPRGTPVADAVVEALRDGAPHMRARSNAQGGFALPLAPNADYELVAHAPGRVGRPRSVSTADPVAPIELLVSAQSVARVRVSPRGPAKITVLGVDGTPDPTLGPRHRAAGAGRVAITRNGVVDIPLVPGRYRFVASRGIEWTIDAREAAVASGETVAVDLAIERAVATPGYLAGDFHQHARPSGDAAVSLDDRVLTNLAEGVEILGATDHNAITDYAAAVARAGARGAIAIVTGVEATSEYYGHFNAFPLPLAPDAPRGGAPNAGRMRPGDIFDAVRAIAPGAIVQVNHPRAAGIGYFRLAGFDADADRPPAGFRLDFDAIEVLNGKRFDETPDVLRDWFWLLRHGHRVTAMGNSDSHYVVGQEVGYPRSYVGAGTDDPGRVTPDAVVDAIRRGDVVVTNGPYLRVEAGGRSAVGRTLPPGTPVRVSVDAAPWVHVDTLTLYRDGTEFERIPVAAGARVDRTLPPGSWYVFLVRGSRPLDPVAPGAVPFALANPVWIEPAR
ncbi:MAG: hypothetical protein D6689_02455 [Deltaproteobacteria bacterium]|nr:MAG: hypothetical protein D6689_02455 [Deltaproteobacteria bacterium]